MTGAEWNRMARAQGRGRFANVSTDATEAEARRAADALIRAPSPGLSADARIIDASLKAAIIGTTASNRLKGVAGQLVASDALRRAARRAGGNMGDLSAGTYDRLTAAAGRLTDRSDNPARYAMAVVSRLNSARRPADWQRIHQMGLALENANFHSAAGLYFNKAALLYGQTAAGRAGR